MVNELSLGLGTDTTAAVLGEESDTDLVVSKLAPLAPSHPTSTGTILKPDRKEGSLFSNEAILPPAALQLTGTCHAEAKELKLPRRGRIPEQPDQVRQVSFLDRT